MDIKRLPIFEISIPAPREGSDSKTQQIDILARAKKMALRSKKVGSDRKRCIGNKISLLPYDLLKVRTSPWFSVQISFAPVWGGVKPRPTQALIH